MFDRNIDGPLFSMYKRAFSPNHPILRTTDFHGRVRFKRIVFSLAGKASPYWTDVASGVPCRRSSLFSAFSKHILTAFGLWDVPPPPRPSVTLIVRRCVGALARCSCRADALAVVRQTHSAAQPGAHNRQRGCRGRRAGAQQQHGLPGGGPGRPAARVRACACHCTHARTSVRHTLRAQEAAAIDAHHERARGHAWRWPVTRVLLGASRMPRMPRMPRLPLRRWLRRLLRRSLRRLLQLPLHLSLRGFALVAEPARRAAPGGRAGAGGGAGGAHAQLPQGPPLPQRLQVHCAPTHSASARAHAQ